MPKGITNVGGYDRAWQGLNLTLNEIGEPERGHPQIRVGHALLWTSILHEAFMRTDKTSYINAMKDCTDAAPMWGLILARNGLLHGAALCVDLSKDQKPTAINWIWTEDIAALTTVLDKLPGENQQESYINHVSGRRINEPFTRARNWLKIAATLISI